MEEARQFPYRLKSVRVSLPTRMKNVIDIESDKNKIYKIGISIADLPILIYSTNLSFIKHISKEYSSFLHRSKPVFCLKIKFNPLLKCLPLIKGNAIKIDYKNKCIICKSTILKGKINLRDKEAFLELSQDRGEGIFCSLQNFLRILYANILLENKGILIHSANLIKNKNGYLFFGKSGSGKTTVSRSAIKNNNILSDDIAIIRKIKRTYKIFGSPFWGMLREELNPVNKSASIKCAFKLIQKDYNLIKEKKRKYALLDLVSCTSFVPKNKKEYKKVVDILYDFINNIPVFDLYFTKKCNFWSVIK